MPPAKRKRSASVEKDERVVDNVVIDPNSVTVSSSQRVNASDFMPPAKRRRSEKDESASEIEAAPMLDNDVNIKASLLDIRAGPGAGTDSPAGSKEEELGIVSSTDVFGGLAPLPDLPMISETSRTTKVSRSQTPVIIGSSSLPETSAKGQHNLKQAMKNELASCLYQSDQLLDKIFNTSPEQNLEKVIEDCIGKFNESPLPKSGAERDYYASFVGRLNIVKKSLGAHGLMEGSIYKDVLFEIYDDSMKEGTGKDAPLKPDILARVPPATGENASWMDIELCAEVKGRYGDMVAQGATYARSIFDAQRSRYFVLVIFYEQKAANVSFGLFTPAWLCLSPKSNIQTDDGQRQFIRDMARIWSCKSRWSAGFDMTCNNTMCYLGEEGTFSFHRNLFHRISVVGRQTRVDVMTDGKVDTAQTDDPHSGIVVYGLHEYTTSRVSVTTTEQSSEIGRSARLTEKANTRPASETLSKTSPDRVRPCDVPVFDPPCRYDKLILKDSWPILSREQQEEKVFEDLGSKFGVPTVLHSFPVTIQQDNAAPAIKSDTAWLFPDNAIPLNLWKLKTPTASQGPSQLKEDTNKGPEHRVHVRLLIRTKGQPLHKAKGPKELLQAILHAMIGYWVIFEKGWLHRDVSGGNVLLMETPEKRDRIEGFESILTEDILEKYFDKCTGFISDGDLAVQWNDMDREVAKQRSGTPPYMSRRLITAMLTNSQVPHSAVDDLESFVWVLFSAVLRTMEFHGATFSLMERQYWSCLQSLDPTQLDRRAGFERKLRGQTKALKDDAQKSEVPRDPSRAFEPFVGLLLEWLLFANELEDLDLDSAGYPGSLRPHFGKYLQIGIKHLEGLPETWDYAREPSNET